MSILSETKLSGSTLQPVRDALARANGALRGRYRNRENPALGAYFGLDALDQLDETIRRLVIVRDKLAGEVATHEAERLIERVAVSGGK